MINYTNFLATSYRPYRNTIVLGNLRNFHEEKETSYIVYCEPEVLPFDHLSDFLNEYSNNSFKKYLTFRTKRILNVKLNLVDVFNALKAYLQNVSANTEAPIMNIQKFFTPYYTQNIVLKTNYWNVLTMSDVIIQLNVLYETSEPITYDNIPSLEKLTIDESEDLRIEINYDIQCPYFEKPIRFVFQYLFQINYKDNI